MQREPCLLLLLLLLTSRAPPFTPSANARRGLPVTSPPCPARANSGRGRGTRRPPEGLSACERGNEGTVPREKERETAAGCRRRGEGQEGWGRVEEESGGTDILRLVIERCLARHALDDQDTGYHSDGGSDMDARSVTASANSTEDMSGSQSQMEEEDSWDLITCFCMKPFAGRPMIECGECGTWVHLSCAKIRRTHVPEVFTCQRCRDAKQTIRRSGRARSGPQTLQRLAPEPPRLYRQPPDEPLNYGSANPPHPGPFLSKHWCPIGSLGAACRFSFQPITAPADFTLNSHTSYHSGGNQLVESAGAAAGRREKPATPLHGT
ncbi:hypothetical protein ANANG_G00129490 [Anguilla anguilla]|uniref:Zinc finger PHD-type domain-containing protein n=1 Tax=Anguilla anguilla TaxID=7936 RepID=A0A9D3MGT3_ANGAN|nr:hypothetical protein ANANG_G00129490 [Anguilla anguilla]